MQSNALQKRTWAEIDVKALTQNFKAVRQMAGASKLCCVVKANAYGHGAIFVARLYQRLGADFLAVSNPEEAMELRQAGVSLPILILGYTDPALAELLSLQNISQCVFSESYGAALSQSASRAGVKVKIHIKLDTGMGRIGFLCRGDGNDELDAAARVCRMSGLVSEGIFTHFCSADEGEAGRACTEQQFARFQAAVSSLERDGIRFSLRHAANSAALLSYPHMRLDMVRAGLVLYGLSPSSCEKESTELRQALTLKTIVDHIKTLSAGESVSYGRVFTAQREMRVATVPIGYADGLWRSTSANGGCVEIAGKPARILGRICMDQCVIDVSDIDGVEVGSVATVYGHSRYNSIPAIAAANQTIPYELLCAVGQRVPRVYENADD